MTEAQVAWAVAELEAQGKVPSSRNILRVLRRTGPRFRGGSFRDVLPILRYQYLTAEARQAINALDACTAQVDALLASGTGRRDRLMVAGEAAKDVVLALMAREEAAGRPVVVFDASLARWAAASSRLIWGADGRPW
jgi:hypothetical protein